MEGWEGERRRECVETDPQVGAASSLSFDREALSSASGFSLPSGMMIASVPDARPPLTPIQEASTKGKPHTGRRPSRHPVFNSALRPSAAQGAPALALGAGESARPFYLGRPSYTIFHIRAMRRGQCFAPGAPPFVPPQA